MCPSLTTPSPSSSFPPKPLSSSFLLHFPKPFHPKTPSLPQPSMADNFSTSSSTFFQRLHQHSPNSTQLIGLLTLFITGSIFLFLTGLTIAGTVLGLIFFTPLIILTIPIWVPVGTVLFVVVAGFLSMCGFGVLGVAILSWVYRYFHGLNPPGSDRVDYARNRIYDTASHVKDYAREYGGYLQSKVKDAAPGA